MRSALSNPSQARELERKSRAAFDAFLAKLGGADEFRTRHPEPPYEWHPASVLGTEETVTLPMLRTWRRRGWVVLAGTEKNVRTWEVA